MSDTATITVPTTLGSAAYSDDAFLRAFEDGSLPPEGFHHTDHVRMTWLYLRAHGLDEGTRRIRDGIQLFAGRLGAATKYHETITVAWTELVWNALQQTPDIADAPSFVAAHPALADKGALARHYTKETLTSERARREYVAPDRKPIGA